MYKAVVCRVKVRPHPNADRLQLGSVVGFQVIVGLDTQDGDLGIFFPPDGQLSDDYCKANNLYPVVDEVTGKKIGGGFIDPNNRRVRAQSFRGEKSFGLWMPIESLNFCASCPECFREGDEFTEINGTLICNRYETEATRKAARTKAQGKKQPKTIMFPEHIDTKQFKYYLQDIPAGSLITITEKLHGTSGRYGHVLVTEPLKWWQKVLNKIGFNFTNTKWSYLNGSRRVILGQTNNPGFYGSDEFRFKSTQGIGLHKGEMLYFELVGFYTESNTIMPTPNNSVLGKEFVARYGDYTTFSYGVLPGQCDLYVYRINQINPDGVQVELSWNQVKARCKELGLKHVPELTTSMFWKGDQVVDTPQFLFEGNSEWLQRQVESITDGPSTLDSGHIREGVVVRVDQPNGETKWYKNKSHDFYVLEGIIKDTEQVDMEEANDIATT